MVSRGAGIRSPGLDLFRFLAATVVFLGHTIYFSSYSSNLQNTSGLDVIRTGAFAVDFFFLLSGYVLADDMPDGRWMAARYLRLYPVYLVGIFLGLLVNLAVNQTVGTSLAGLLLTLIGFQALFPEFSLALNGPLWSLSVEFLVIPLFLVYWKCRERKITMVFLLLLSIILSQVVSGSIVLLAIPFFTLGAILKHFNRESTISSSSYATTVVFIVFVLYFLGGATQIRRLDYSALGISIKLIILGSLIQCLVRMKFSPKFAYLCIGLGKRSYVLYAIHAPLVGLFLAALKPSTLIAFLFYALLLTCTVTFLTEVVYRKIEQPAINWARQKRN